MKRCFLLLLFALLFLAGCGRQEEGDMHPEWDAQWTRAGNLLAAETPEGFRQLESNDRLSFSGIWVFTWACGEGVSITNADEEEAQIFDAQLYLLVRQFDSEAEAQANVKDWIARESQNYETGEETFLSAGGQDFRVLPLLGAGTDNPYSHGAAAFAVRGRLALSAELLCADGYSGDPQAVLTQFLSDVHYGE